QSWIFVPQLDVCVCVPAKCGVTSFRLVLHPELPTMAAFCRNMLACGLGPFRADIVHEKFANKSKFLSVRDLVERIASLWRDKCREEPSKGARGPLYGLSPGELIARIHEFPLGNGHWLPQYGYLVPGVELIPHD